MYSRKLLRGSSGQVGGWYVLRGLLKQNSALARLSSIMCSLKYVVVEAGLLPISMARYESIETERCSLWHGGDSKCVDDGATHLGTQLNAYIFVLRK
jgi:hypothetical protein